MLAVYRLAYDRAMSEPGGPLPESTWRLLAERASDGLFISDADQRIRWCNRAGLALFGHTADELIGRRVTDLYVDADAQLARLPLQYDAIMGGASITIVRTIRTGTGAARSIEIDASPLDEGLVLAVARDVTERVAAEERLARSEESFRAVIESMADAVVVHHEGKAVYANPAFARLLGYARPEDVIGVPIIEHVHPDDRAAVIERVRRLDTGVPTVPFTEERLLARDGTVITAQIGGVHVEFHGQTCVVAIAHDVTDERRLQARLIEADRLVALGTLSAGIAHEVNNPLTYVMLHQEAIAGALDKLRTADNTDLVDRLVQNVAIAQDGAQRVRDIVRDLKIFARASDDAKSPVDVRIAVGRALAIAGHELRGRVTVETDLAEVPRVMASDGRLTQVFLNLIVNAAHAIAGPADANTIEVRAWAEGANVKVSVRDTGVGIAPEHLPRLFEPFFTTKAVGEGCGLGLSVVHGIVTALGGAIAVESELGAGTTFTVTLPAA